MSIFKMNRLANTKNKYQGDSKRVLCVCSAGLLRSPTAAWVLGNAPYNFNTRSAGLSDDYALIVVDSALLVWADEIVCMSPDQEDSINLMLDKLENSLSVRPKVVCLNIEDNFAYKDPELIKNIKEKYDVARRWLPLEDLPE